MSVDRRLLEMREAEAQLDAKLNELRTLFSDGGGSGGGGGVEQRVGRLENQFDGLRADNVQLRDRLSDTKQDLADRISAVRDELKGFIVRALSVTVAILVGLVTFAEKLQNLVR